MSAGVDPSKGLPPSVLSATVPTVETGNLTAPERETTITATDADELVTIWTAQKRYIGRLRRNKKFTETAHGWHGTTEWAQFTIPATEWNPVSGAKRATAPLSEERRAAMVERLHKARAAAQELCPTCGKEHGSVGCPEWKNT